MLFNFKEKPYIKCGNKKIKLEQGDYILDNTVCKQYISKNPHSRTSVGTPYKISKKELDRLYADYNFERKTYIWFDKIFNEHFFKN